MAYANVPISLLPDYLNRSTFSSTAIGLQKSTISATTHYFACIFIAPKSGNIQYIGVPIAGVAATPPDLTASLEGVTTTRVPNGSAFGYTLFTPTSGYNWIDVGGISVTAGTNYALVIRDQSVLDGGGTSADATHDATIGWQYSPKNTNNDGFISPLSTYYNGSSNSTGSDIPVIIPKYDDGTIPLGFIPLMSADLGSTTYSSSSTPAQRGIVFSVPFKCKCGGAYAVTAQVNSNSVFTARIRHGITNEVLRSVTFTANLNYNPQDSKVFVQWPDIELEPNTPYRIILAPTTTNGIYDRSLRFNTSDDLSLFTRGVTICRTTGNGTTWTDAPTELTLVSPVITEIYANGRRGIE